MSSSLNEDELDIEEEEEEEENSDEEDQDDDEGPIVLSSIWDFQVLRQRGFEKKVEVPMV